MESFAEYASFLIRVWREASSDPDAQVSWHVEIVHIQNQERLVLDSLAALAAFLREQSGDPNLLLSKRGLR